MDIRSRSPVEVAPGMGPRPAGTVAATPVLSESRSALLGILRARSGPVTLAAMQEATGLHPNTVREHLTGLAQDGLVTRSRAAASGRGRPAWLYEAAEPEPQPDGPAYAGLAGALAATIQRTSTSPHQDGAAAGAQWGQDLARAGPGAPGSEQVDVPGRVVGLLRDLGFAPDTSLGDTHVRLTRCPLLATATRFPDVVCAVHLGIVRGALETYGADPERAALFPFSEPGACLLTLTPADGGTV